jgi:hypothetical protein
MNYIPKDLIYPFKAAKISKSTTKQILMKFPFDLHKDIYEAIWKSRTQEWKQFKKDNQITKKSFTNYHHNNSSNDPSLQRQPRLF